MTKTQHQAWALLCNYFYAEHPLHVRMMPEMVGVQRMIEQANAGMNDFDALFEFGARELGDLIMAKYMAYKLAPEVA